MSRRKDDDNSASRFQQRIRLERPVITQDSLGDKLTVWVSEGDYWAEIRPISGKEELRHDALKHSITHRIYMRYYTDIKESYRIIYNERVMQIHAIINVAEEDAILKLWVEELT